jgi:hypothetical protein
MPPKPYRRKEKTEEERAREEEEERERRKAALPQQAALTARVSATQRTIANAAIERRRERYQPRPSTAAAAGPAEEYEDRFNLGSRGQHPFAAAEDAGILDRTLAAAATTATVPAQVDEWYPKHTCEMDRIRLELVYVSVIVTCVCESNISKNNIKQYYDRGVMTPNFYKFLLCIEELFGKLRKKIEKYAFIDALCRLNLYEVFENNGEIMNELREQIIERQSDITKSKKDGGDSLINYVTTFVYQRPAGELSLGKNNKYGLRDTHFFPFDDKKFPIQLGKKEDMTDPSHIHEISPVMEYFHEQVLYRTKQTLYRMLRLVLENGYNLTFQYKAGKDYTSIIVTRLGDHYDPSYAQVGRDVLEDFQSNAIRREYVTYQENTTPENDLKYEAKMREKVVDPVTGDEVEKEVDQTQKLREMIVRIRPIGIPARKDYSGIKEGLARYTLRIVEQQDKLKLSESDIIDNLENIDFFKRPDINLVHVVEILKKKEEEFREERQKTNARRKEILEKIQNDKKITEENKKFIMDNEFKFGMYLIKKYRGKLTPDDVIPTIKFPVEEPLFSTIVKLSEFEHKLRKIGELIEEIVVYLKELKSTPAIAASAEPTPAIAASAEPTLVASTESAALILLQNQLIDIINGDQFIKKNFSEIFPDFLHPSRTYEECKNAIKEYIKTVIMGTKNRTIRRNKLGDLLQPLLTGSSRDHLEFLMELDAIIRAGTYDYITPELRAIIQTRIQELQEQFSPQRGGKYINANKYIHKIEKYSQKIEYLLRK